ncbi:MAG: pantoate--beta-alanine ligase [Actinomycetes bacterium]
MITVRSQSELEEAIRPTGMASNGPIGFVPTMGSLHQGHLSLVRSSVAEGGMTVASVFVNPTQFGPGEDFDAYPRDEATDSELLESAGCDVLFLPRFEDVYPEGFATTVLADRSLTGVLCGRSRGDSHFDGVTTVVARLFGLVRPDFACFGEKDWQQLRIVTRMASDLHPSLRIIPCPTVREPDGLAMSSRNANLSDAERSQAAALPAALRSLADAASQGEGNPAVALGAASARLNEAGLEVDYLEIRHADDLTSCADPARHSCDADPAHLPRVFVAARTERTRLIDNEPIFTGSTRFRTSHQTAKGAATARRAASTT